jgi:hypothetical protein
MARKTVSVVRPTAADVRKFAAENPAKFAKVSEKAAHTLREGARGRLHPEVIAAYNKGRKPERQYVLGRGKEVAAEAKALRAQAVALGAGRRGPIRKEVLAQMKG